jgi:hypothetical protein
MAVLSGKNGTIHLDGSPIAPVSNWRLAVTSSNVDYVANDTGGWKCRAPGPRDSSGSFQLKVDDGGQCPVAKGDAVTLDLHVDQTGDNYYSAAAIIDKIEVEVDIGAGKIVAYAVEFSGNGAVLPHGIVAKPD